MFGIQLRIIHFCIIANHFIFMYINPAFEPLRQCNRIILNTIAFGIIIQSSV